MLYVLLFLLEVIVLSILEKKIWGTFFTPLNFLSIPYTFVTLIAILYSNAFVGVPDFYEPSLLIWMGGLLLFFCSSLLFSVMNINKKDVLNINVGKNDDLYNTWVAISLFCIVLSLFRIHSIMSSSMLSFGSDDFSDKYVVKGLFAHISVLMCSVFSYMIYKVDSLHRFSWVVISLMLIGMYAIGVKSWIIAPFLIGYYARLLSGKTKFSIKNILLPALVCISIFVLSYYFIMIISSKSELSAEWFSFIVNHFVDYLTGGTLSLSLDIKAGVLEPENIEALFAPIVNFFNLLSGNEYVNPINPIFLSIGDLGYSNVRTFFGTIYVYTQNVFAFVLVSFFFGNFVYWIFCCSRNSNNLYILLACCGNLAFLSLGFFEFYWLNLSPYELMIYFLLMSIFSRITLQVRK